MANRTFPRGLFLEAIADADMDHGMVVEGYSGRGMWERTCVAVKLENSYGQLAKLMVGLGAVAATSHCDDDECEACELDDLPLATLDLAASVEIDNLGYDLIAYFPGWQLSQ